jgi:MoxR-like ATPase
MVEFARYYIDFIRQLFANIGEFFKKLFEAFAGLLFNGVVQFFETFTLQSENFLLLDWVMAFLVLSVNIAFVVFLVLKIYQWMRRYIKFSVTEIEKDELLEEISFLNQKTVELIDEKNKILALKVSNLGIGSEEQKEKAKKQLEKDDEYLGPSRFVKLLQVDKEYENQIIHVHMKDEDMINLNDLVKRFINFSASRLGLFYDKKIISAFFAGMAASKTMILEGISGTGKTSLPYAMGKFFSNDANIIAVQPSWRDRSEMIGYLNEFTKKFNETDFLKAIYETTYRDDICIIVLDEMNLARVEYYFAELLSLLEMPDEDQWLIDIVPDNQPGDPKHIINGKILLPQNVWFIGTANKDDSTFTITDKVYDRATPIEINTKSSYIDAPDTDGVNFSYDYLMDLYQQANKDHPLSLKAIENLEKLDNFITKNLKVTFGNRIMKQIKAFVPVYVACGNSEYEALDYMVARKIFRKFESLNLPFLQDEINELSQLIDRIFGKNQFVECQAYLTMIKKQF